MNTSDATAAERWQEGRDRLLSQNHGPDAAFTEALACNDGLALAYGCLAFWYTQHARSEAARARIQRALVFAAGITRRERQQLEAIHLWIQSQGRQAQGWRDGGAAFPEMTTLHRFAAVVQECAPTV